MQRLTGLTPAAYRSKRDWNKKTGPEQDSRTRP